MSEMKSLCGNLDLHRLYFLENAASRVAPTKLKIEKACGNRFLLAPTQTLKLRPPKLLLQGGNVGDEEFVWQPRFAQVVFSGECCKSRCSNKTENRKGMW